MMGNTGSPIVRAHSTLWAILHLRCPRCHHGRVFHGMFAMNEQCPVCLLRFEREPGYFVGAMYISYIIASIIVAASFVGFILLFPDAPEVWLYVATCGILLPLVPLIFRYSRVIWITFDRAIDT